MGQTTEAYNGKKRRTLGRGVRRKGKVAERDRQGSVLYRGGEPRDPS